MSVVFDNPVQPVLALPPDLAAWQQCETLPDPAGRWRTYLHRLAAAALQTWMQEEGDQAAQLWPPQRPVRCLAAGGRASADAGSAPNCGDAQRNH